MGAIFHRIRAHFKAIITCTELLGEGCGPGTPVNALMVITHELHVNIATKCCSYRNFTNDLVNTCSFWVKRVDS